VNGPGQLADFGEAVKQVAVADRLVVTKTDLATGDAVITRLRTLNPTAPITRLPADPVSPATLFQASLYDPTTKTPDVRRWLGEHAHDHGGHDPQSPRRRHRSFCLTADTPLPGTR